MQREIDAINKKIESLESSTVNKSDFTHLLTASNAHDEKIDKLVDSISQLVSVQKARDVKDAHYEKDYDSMKVEFKAMQTDVRWCRDSILKTESNRKNSETITRVVITVITGGMLALIFNV